MYKFELKETLKWVCEYTGQSINDVKSRKRDRPIATARHLYCYLARKHFGNSGYTLTDIGRLIKRSHDVVIHSIKVVESALNSKDKSLRYFAEVVETFGRSNGPCEYIVMQIKSASTIKDKLIITKAEEVAEAMTRVEMMANRADRVLIMFEKQISQDAIMEGWRLEQMRREIKQARKELRALAE